MFRTFPPLRLLFKFHVLVTGRLPLSFFFRSLIVQMTTAEANALESIPADQQGSFSSFLKTLASFTGDLSSLTCPSFLLAPISLLEYS